MKSCNNCKYTEAEIGDRPCCDCFVGDFGLSEYPPTNPKPPVVIRRGYIRDKCKVYAGSVTAEGFLCDTGVLVVNPTQVFENEKSAKIDLLLEVAKVQAEQLHRDMDLYSQLVANPTQVFENEKSAKIDLLREVAKVQAEQLHRDMDLYSQTLGEIFSLL